MYHPRQQRNVTLLWALVVLAFAYAGWLTFLRPQAEANDVEGGLGVLLGLYIASRPAANILNMILPGGSGRLPGSRRAETGWVVLNLLVTVVAFAVIFMGTTRFIARTP
jgi:hypothetical protein